MSRPRPSYAKLRRDLANLHRDYAALAADALNARTALRRLLRVADGDSTAWSRATNLARAVLKAPFPTPFPTP